MRTARAWWFRAGPVVCVYCGRRLYRGVRGERRPNATTCTVDHFWPDTSVYVPACYSCNNAKARWDPWAYAAGLANAVAVRERIARYIYQR